MHAGKKVKVSKCTAISKADPSVVQALCLATGLAEEIWKPQQPVFTCHLFHGLATSLPIPLGIPCLSYVCRWLGSTQMEVTQFPSDGLQEEWQGVGHHNISQPLTPLSTQETERGCLTALGAVANCPEIPFLTGKRQRVTFTCSHFAHMQQNPRSHRPLDLQYKHKSATQCRMRWPSHQVTGRSSVVV